MVDREGESDREILVDRRSERDGKSNKIVKLERAVSIKLLCNYQSTKQGEEGGETSTFNSRTPRSHITHPEIATLESRVVGNKKYREILVFAT